MARNFNGSSQYLVNTSAVLTTVPMTIACWYKPSSTSSYYVMASIGFGGSDLNNFSLFQHSSNRVMGDSRDGVPNVVQAITSTGTSAGAWTHACAVFASSTSRSAYINGASKGTDTTSLTPPSGVNQTTIGAWADLGNFFLSGDIAEVAIWNVALSDAEVASLYVSPGVGVYPSDVQPTHLVGYWKLLGSSSPEPDSAGSNPMTLVGSPASATHPTMQNLSGGVTAISGRSVASSYVYSAPWAPPALPAVFYDTTYTAPTGSTITVGAGGDFQAALNSASPGDVITLNAGSTYTGNFSLPSKGGSAYIHIRSSTALTTEGVRITTAQAAGFPKIVTSNVGAAIQAAAGASYYRFINCDIKSSSTPVNGKLVGLGTGSETIASDFPHHIIIDRCAIRGDPTNGGRRGVMFAGNYQAVIDSYVSDWKEVGADTQAIAGWTGYGPYKIKNCYLEGAGENVLFGGSDTGVSGLTPSDIEIRNNYFFKPLSWKVGDPSYAGTHWSVKNILELKHCKRVIIEDNLLENCWADSQTGTAILFTVRNQSGSNPWATLEDVTFRNNELRNSGNGINCMGQDFESGIPSDHSRRILISDNVITKIGQGISGDGILFAIYSGYQDIAIDHNTVLHDPGSPTSGSIITTDYEPSPRLRFTNNIVQHGGLGIIGTDFSPGNATIGHYFPASIITGNVIQSDTNYSSNYPLGNAWPLHLEHATETEVGFVNYPTDLRLDPTSPYHNAGTDGTDIGAIIGTPAAPTFKAVWAAGSNQLIAA